MFIEQGNELHQQAEFTTLRKDIQGNVNVNNIYCLIVSAETQEVSNFGS